MPILKDPDRVADPSTLRRWCRNLDSSPWLDFLRTMTDRIHRGVSEGARLRHGPLWLSWSTVFACRQILWPLRL